MSESAPEASRLYGNPERLRRRHRAERRFRLYGAAAIEESGLIKRLSEQAGLQKIARRRAQLALQNIIEYSAMVIKEVVD